MKTFRLNLAVYRLELFKKNEMKFYMSGSRMSKWLDIHNMNDKNLQS